ncbi:hypothetical protein B0T11DRAFT_93594 [Plectosphaerella cucumerina]|uniref:Uncharacterized protein n=1 Tax=Plectosphaerella cucumerina TaxID=40658 RepID=A0A8K0X460_9PEZI|nr:hypothetical protein B0T11DRAFT_93594 [Plectosphaerella cucumerina]
MRFFERLSDKFSNIIKSLNCFSTPPFPPSQKALDAHYAYEQNLRYADFKRTVGRPMHPKVTVWYERDPGRAPNVQPMCMDEMGPHLVKEILVMLPILLADLPFKVCGLGALAAYGFTSRLPIYMTLACPEQSFKAILDWAKVAGMPAHPEDRSCFGIQLQDGTVRQVKVEPISDYAYHATDSTRYGPSNVRIVTLAALLDALAEIYVRDTINQSQRGALQKDIMWLLRRIIDEDSDVHKLRRETCPHVWHPLFWSRFNLERPDARMLFNQATFVPDYRPATSLQPASPTDDLVPQYTPPLRRVGNRSVGHRQLLL